MAIWLAPKNTKNLVQFWIPTLERLTINLADQQLITSMLVILLSLVKYLPQRDAQSLDIAQLSAMFSTVTHLASVRMLRPYLRKYQFLANGRLIIVGLTFMLLIGSHVWFLVRFQRARTIRNVISYQISVLI